MQSSAVEQGRADSEPTPVAGRAELPEPNAITEPPQSAPGAAPGPPAASRSASADRMSGLYGDVSSELPSESGASSSAFDSVLPQQDFDPAELAAQAQTLVEDPLDRPFALRREDLSRPGDLTGSSPQAFVASQPHHGSQRDSEFDAQPAADEPSFVQQARRQARWRHPAVRALLLLVLLALAALLALQVAVQERNRLAAAQPALRPWLVRLCAELACRIAPPRQIDAIAIDSSSFNKLRADAYRLQVTLKNQSRVDVAMPALELTLTDGDEQAVVRRVLMPGELVPARAAIPAGSDWSGSVAIGITDNSLASRVAGYRLLAFYP